MRRNLEPPRLGFALGEKQISGISLLWLAGMIMMTLLEGASPPYYLPGLVIWIGLIGLYAFYFCEKIRIPFAATLVFFLIMMFISSLNAVVYGPNRITFILRITWIFYFILMSSLPREKMFKSFCDGILVIAILQVIVILLQLSYVDPRFYGKAGTLKNPNETAEFLGFASLISFYLFFDNKKDFLRRTFWFFLSILILIGLFLTRSEAVLIAFLCGLGGIFLFHYVPSFYKLVMILIFTTAFLIPLILGPTAQDRTLIWIASTHMIRALPFCGIGQGMFCYQETFSFYKLFGQLDWGHAHSLFWMPASEMGWLGAAAWMTFNILLVLQADMSYSRTRVAGILFMIIWIHGIFDYIHWTIVGQFLYWSVAAFMISPSLSFIPWISFRMRKEMTLLVSAGVLSFGLYLSMLLFPLHWAFSLEKTKQEEALKNYVFVLKIDPWQPVVHQRVGGIYFRRGDFEKAEQFFLKAIEANPSEGSNYILLAESYTQQDLPSLEFNALKKAVSAEPYIADGYYHRRMMRYAQVHETEDLVEYHTLMDELTDVFKKGESAVEQVRLEDGLLP